MFITNRYKSTGKTKRGFQKNPYPRGCKHSSTKVRLGVPEKELLNDELPTLSNLYKRNPLLYTTDQCPFCQIEIENNIHIFTCSSQTGTNPLEKLKEDFKKILIHEAANILQLKLDLESLKKKLELYTSDFDLRNQHLMEFDQICFLDIIAGLIPNSLVSLFKEIMGSSKDGKLVVLRSIHKFKLLLFQLWKSRCEKFLIWERSQNIKAKDKKLGKKKTNNASNMVYESTSIRVYDDIILEQQQQTDNLHVHNYDMDYGSGEKRNSFNTAVFYAKKWLHAKILSGVSIKGTSRFYKTN
ncbi:hypothetical protein Glove_50g62 [Diversispora epigaea]|uniref:Uncharacterized protein n=1 Tax=Diversispora epigaea TaxID=1348612 RepID=A0A397JKN7_9GLOM|nr:hypothetical protein Glove_50g62 [Diversispora epigaea]